MRITLTGTHRASGRSGDVVVHVDPAASLGELVEEIAHALGLPADVVTRPCVDGRPVDVTAAVAGGEVLDGSHVEFGDGPGGPPLVRDLPAVHVLSGPGAGTVHVLAPGVAFVGSSRDATVVLDDDRVPELAVVLRVDAGGRFELGPLPGVEVELDGETVTAPRPVPEGGVVRIGETLVTVAVPSPLAAVSVTEGGGTLDLTRPPRLLPVPPATTYRLPPLPEAPPRRPVPIIAAIAPLVMAVVMVTIFGNVAFLAFGLMSPLVLVGNFLYDRRNGRTTHRARLADHAAKVAVVEADAAEAVRQAQHQRRASAPDSATVLDLAVRRRARLWERRPSDPDHLAVRLGTIDAPSGVIVEDPAEPEHRRRAERVARHVPAVVSLREAGVTGIAGHRADVRELAVSCVGQLAALHSPRDLEIVVLTDADAEGTWSFVRWLPHCRPVDDGRPAVLVGTDAETSARRVAELGRRLDERRSAVERDRDAVPGPAIVVVLDGARRLRALPGLVRLLKEGPRLGVHALCLDTERRLLPEECTTVVTAGRRRHVVSAQGAPVVEDVLADQLPEGWSDLLGRALAPLVDVEDDEGSSLPSSSRLLHVLDLEPPTPEAVLARWVPSGSTEAVVGETIDGPFSVDLRRDGPHALVAGTTGSGKSELLQTLVASLAVVNAPDTMTFVLVDYKGGAAFRDVEALPHTVGMVTDLDAHLVGRALASLGAELRRREHALAFAGCKDLEDHAELRRRDPTSAPPLPRLVIVIDEFASLVRELPDFVPGLVDVARRGRSLGIHLVLATQRPAGVISTEIRANTNLRIALRVTDPAESIDVIDAPDAARIAKSTPGRAHVRLGAGALLPFQAGRVGGRRPGASAGAGVPSTWSTRLTWATLGRPLPVPPAARDSEDDPRTDLQELVTAVRGAAELRGTPAPHRPWLDPVPEQVLLGDLEQPPVTRAGGLPPAPFALLDVPEQQARRVVALDLETATHLSIVGSARSGRSQALRTLAGSLADRIGADDLHLYGIDCGGGALLPLAQLPHTGAVVLRTETERLQRLLARLTALVASRQEQLAAGGWADVGEQRSAVAASDRLPHVVVLLDRWEGFVTSIGELDHGAAVDQVHALLRDGAGVGVHLVLTGDRTLVGSRMASLVDDVLVLRLADRSDYALAGLDPRSLPEEVPDGRCFTVPSGAEAQVALLTADPSGRAQSAALADVARRALERDSALPRERRPFRLDRLGGPLTFAEAWERRPSACPGGFALVGVGGDELVAVGPDLDQGAGTFLVAGPSRSGRSTLLGTMTRSLLAQGREVVVVTPRPSPLRDLDGRERVLRVVVGEPGEDDLARWFDDDAAPPRVLVVDDAELVRAPAVSAWLARHARTCSDRGHALLAGGTTSDLGTGFGGWLVELRRGRAGALLSPQLATEGDLIGARLPRSAVGDRVRPGTALVHLGDGELLQVQVPHG